MEGKNLYQLTEEDLEFIAHYNMEKYDRPSIATDVAIFSIMNDQEEQEEECQRTLPEKRLKVLLIKRKQPPFKDMWALPGGFCRKNEDEQDAAARELEEETGLKDAFLSFMNMYGEVGRDPRGWVMSHSFIALVDGDACTPHAGSDAGEAKWFSVSLEKEEKNRSEDGKTIEVENEYRLSLQEDGEKVQDKTILSAIIKERKIYKNYHEKREYVIKKSEGLAFDHAKIITDAVIWLRQRADLDCRIVFDFFPEKFTLWDLQKAFELVYDKKLLTPNFRRKMSDYVIETEEKTDGVRHRPASLYIRNTKCWLNNH